MHSALVWDYKYTDSLPGLLLAFLFALFFVFLTTLHFMMMLPECVFNCIMITTALVKLEMAGYYIFYERKRVKGT